MHEPDDLQGSETISAIHAELHTTPPPDMDTLATLLERVQPLTQQTEDTVVAEARRLELRILGAIMHAQAATLRRMAQQLQRAAHWLPPERPEFN